METKGKIRVLFSSNKNPNFETFTDYIEKALNELRCDTVFFENRHFILPGRIRDKVGFLNKGDLYMLNKRLLNITLRFKPHLFLEDGGWNILPSTLRAMNKAGIVTALWTNDPPRFQDRHLNSLKENASNYDYVFVTGSEGIDFFKKTADRLHLLPFASDPDYHKPIALINSEKNEYSYDVCFVGSGWKDLYPYRIRLLEGLTNFKLGIWGPGWETLSSMSPLKKIVNGGQLRTAEWVKLFSTSKIVFHSHFQDPLKLVPNYQVNPRVFEALACGSFLLVDDQKDISYFFKNGEHLVIYKNINDLRAKVAYYLNNDDERKRIADSGRKEVLEKHTYKHRVRDIINTVMGSWIEDT
jgi:spore maturation protein CgeB